jgi:predicted TIM-barrel fold metal-dependent hydrolase
MERTEEYFHIWRQAMRLLAHADNVYCKISGLGMTDHHWNVKSIRPWVEACIELFGPHRCMFGSNWPVDSLYSSYRTIIDAYREIIHPLSLEEKRRVMYLTAEMIYGI